MFLCFHGNCSINRLLPQQISQLVQEVSAKEQKLLPKKKFAFKSRKKTSQPQTKEAEGREGEGGGRREREEGGGGRGSNIQLKNLVGFRDRKDEKLLMSVSCKMGQAVLNNGREPGSLVSTFVLTTPCLCVGLAG